MICDLQTQSQQTMKTVKTKLFLLALLSAFSLQPLVLRAQGSLAPPGAPAPTMKTLDQIEARTPVDATHTPGDSGDLFVIAYPGSYYLTTNIVGVSGKSGILVGANNVTLDLNGFSVLGVATALFGVDVPNASITNVTVRNGIISGWTNPGPGYYGIVSYGRISHFEHLTVCGNSAGVQCGPGTVIENCTISGNLGIGIDVFSDSLVVGNQCFGNNATNAVGVPSIFIGGSNNRIEDNHVTGTGAGGYGIWIFASASYTNNLVIKNFVAGSGANNYSFNASQIVGPLITTTGMITNVNPWANFSY